MKYIKLSCNLKQQTGGIKMKYLLLVTVIMFSSACYAKIGASESTCKNKYGKPQQKTKKKSGKEYKRTYYHNKSTIFITYSSMGSAVKVVYTDIKPNLNEINAILKLNSSGQKWKVDGENHWSRSNGMYSAKYLGNPIVDINGKTPRLRKGMRDEKHARLEFINTKYYNQKEKRQKKKKTAW
jgi:hypothetical protein